MTDKGGLIINFDEEDDSTPRNTTSQPAHQATGLAQLLNPQFAIPGFPWQKPTPKFGLVNQQAQNSAPPADTQAEIERLKQQIAVVEAAAARQKELAAKPNASPLSSGGGVPGLGPAQERSTPFKPMQPKPAPVPRVLPPPSSGKSFQGRPMGLGHRQHSSQISNQSQRLAGLHPPPGIGNQAGGTGQHHSVSQDSKAVTPSPSVTQPHSERSLEPDANSLGSASKKDAGAKKGTCDQDSPTPASTAAKEADLFLESLQDSPKRGHRRAEPVHISSSSKKDKPRAEPIHGSPSTQRESRRAEPVHGSPGSKRESRRAEPIHSSAANDSFGPMYPAGFGPAFMGTVGPYGPFSDAMFGPGGLPMPFGPQFGAMNFGGMMDMFPHAAPPSGPPPSSTKDKSPARKVSLVQKARAEKDKVQKKASLPPPLPPSGDPPGFMPPLPPSPRDSDNLLTPKDTPWKRAKSASRSAEKAGEGASRHDSKSARKPRSAKGRPKTPESSKQREKRDRSRENRLREERRSPATDKSIAELPLPPDHVPKDTERLSSKDKEHRQKLPAKEPEDGNEKSSKERRNGRKSKGPGPVSESRDLVETSDKRLSAAVDLTEDEIAVRLEELRTVLKQKEALLLRRKVLDTIYEEAHESFDTLRTRESDLTALLGSHADDAALRIFSTDDILSSALAVTPPSSDPLEDMLEERRKALRLRRAQHVSKTRETLEAQNLPTDFLASGDKSISAASTDMTTAPPQIVATTEGEQVSKATKRKFSEILREFVSEDVQEPSRSGQSLEELRKTLLEKATPQDSKGTTEKGSKPEDIPPQDRTQVDIEAATRSATKSHPSQATAKHLEDDGHHTGKNRPETEKVDEAPGLSATEAKAKTDDDRRSTRSRSQGHVKAGDTEDGRSVLSSAEKLDRQNDTSWKGRHAYRRKRSRSRSREGHHRSRDHRSRSRSQRLRHGRSASRSRSRDRRRKSRDHRSPRRRREHRRSSPDDRRRRSLSRARDERRGPKGIDRGREFFHGPTSLSQSVSPRDPRSQPRNQSPSHRGRESSRGRGRGQFGTTRREDRQGQGLEKTAIEKADVTASQEAREMASNLSKLIQEGDRPVLPGVELSVEHKIASSISTAVQQLADKNKMPKGGDSIRGSSAKQLRIVLFKALSTMLPTQGTTTDTSLLAAEVTRLLGEEIMSGKLFQPKAPAETASQSAELPQPPSTDEPLWTLPMPPGHFSAVPLPQSTSRDAPNGKASEVDSDKPPTDEPAKSQTEAKDKTGEAAKAGLVEGGKAGAGEPALPKPPQIPGQATDKAKEATTQQTDPAPKPAEATTAGVSSGHDPVAVSGFKVPSDGLPSIGSRVDPVSTHPDHSRSPSVAQTSQTPIGTKLAHDSAASTPAIATRAPATLQTPSGGQSPANFIAIPPTVKPAAMSAPAAVPSPAHPLKDPRLARVIAQTPTSMAGLQDQKGSPAVISNHSDPNAVTPMVQNKRLIWPDTPEAPARSTSAGTEIPSAASPEPPTASVPIQAQKITIDPAVLAKKGDGSIFRSDRSCFVMLAQSGLGELDRWQPPVEPSTALVSIEESSQGRDNMSQYESPLLAFRSYRLCPTYQTVSKQPLSSRMFANAIEPNWPLCPFELRGSCRDNECPYQMNHDSTLNNMGVLHDLHALTRRAGGKTFLPPVNGSESSTLERNCQDIMVGSTSQILSTPGEPKPKQKRRISEDKIQSACIDGDVPNYSDFFTSKPQQAFRSVLLGGVTLLDPPFEGGALLGWDGGDVPLSSYKQTRREGASQQDRYFSQKAPEAPEDEVSADAAENDVSEQKWVKRYEDRLQADPQNEEIMLLYALEAFHRSPGPHGEYVQTLKLLAKALDAFPNSATIWRLYIHLYATHVGSQPESDVLNILDAATQYQPDSYHLWLVCVSKVQKLEDRVKLLQRGIVFLSGLEEKEVPTDQVKEKLSASEAKSKAACVLDLWLRLALNISQGLPAKLSSWLDLLVADESQEAPKPPPASTEPSTLGGTELEKLAIQRLRATLQPHPLLKFVMWSTAANLAAYSSVPTRYIHSLGYPAQPEALEFHPAPHVDRNERVHRILSFSSGNSYGCLDLRATAEVEGRAFSSVEDAEAIQLAVSSLAAWQITSGTAAVVSSYGHKMSPLVDFQPLLLSSYRAAEYIRLNPKDASRQAALDAYAVSNRLLHYIIATKGDALVEDILPPQQPALGKTASGSQAGGAKPAADRPPSRLIVTTTRAGGIQKSKLKEGADQKDATVQRMVDHKELTAQRMVAKWPWMKELYNNFSKDKPAFQKKMATLSMEEKASFKAFCVKVKEQKAATAAAKAQAARLHPLEASFKILQATAEALSGIPAAMIAPKHYGTRLPPTVVLALALRVHALSNGRADLAAMLLAASLIADNSESSQGQVKRKEPPGSESPDHKRQKASDPSPPENPSEETRPDQQPSLPPTASDQQMAATITKAVLRNLQDEGKLLDSEHIRNIFKPVLEPTKPSPAEEGEIADDELTDESILSPMSLPWHWLNLACYELLSSRSNNALSACEEAVSLATGTQKDQIGQDQLELMSMLLSGHSRASDLEGPHHTEMLSTLSTAVRQSMNAKRASCVVKPLEWPPINFSDPHLSRELAAPISIQAESLVTPVLTLLPRLSSHELAHITERVAAMVALSPALARLAVDVLEMHSSEEQWVSWAGPFAAQALVSSIPTPAPDLWLKAIHLIETHSRTAAHELSNIAFVRWPCSPALAEKHVTLCSFVGPHAKRQAQSRLAARFAA